MTRTTRILNDEEYRKAMKKLTGLSYDDDEKLEEEIMTIILGSKENYEKYKKIMNEMDERG